MSGSKLLRLFSLFLCLLLCLANFSVVASAAEEDENLIDGTLSNWVDAGDLYPNFYDNVNTGASGIGDNWQHVTLTPEYRFAFIYDLSNLSIDTPYKFSFEYQIVNPSLSIFNVFDVYIGVATLDNSIGLPSGNTEPRVEYVLTSENYTDFLENGFSMQFNLSSFVGQPCVYFAFAPKEGAILSQTSAILHVRDVSLVQVDENSKKLDGILGWLQELWNSIKDGFANLGSFITHLGDRIQIKLGEVITYLSGELQSVRQSITTKLGEINTYLTGEIQIHGYRIRQSIHDFFVPPEGFFDTWKGKFNLMLENNLGFVYQAPNFVKDIVEVVQEILQTDQEVNLVFPAVEFDIADYHIELFKDTKVDFSFLEAGIWFTLYSMYKVMLYVIFSLALIKYGMSTWEGTMSN